MEEERFFIKNLGTTLQCKKGTEHKMARNGKQKVKGLLEKK